MSGPGIAFNGDRFVTSRSPEYTR
ncbi:hypothetical protein CGLO_00534 [Colletotrichum gloeosporioides Cg-14]|uniref:Uncharacterized protein n=1 Tax=Colletotrichum gloeosporioides (strain Cg-14) TaxID=1237896 RepID=T0MDQ5_COLGC|nr:hypothetical protein CGLO_00534 [Colletotrichum gloeosporioides Cg-14]